MGAQQMPRPMKRGTSKAVPVVVSAGLAVGVFCGLLFGVGTGKNQAQAAPATGNNVKKEEESKPDPNAAPAGLGATSTAPVKTPPAGGTGPGAPVVAQGSAATPPPPTPSVPEKKLMKLTIKIKPDGAATDAKISIDGTAITGISTDIPLDKKTVKVEVKSSGYHSAEKKLDVSEGDMTLEIELTKRSSGGGTGGGVKPPKRPDRPPSGGGGLIDI